MSMVAIDDMAPVPPPVVAIPVLPRVNALQAIPKIHDRPHCLCRSPVSVPYSASRMPLHRHRTHSVMGRGHGPRSLACAFSLPPSHLLTCHPNPAPAHLHPSQNPSQTIALRRRFAADRSRRPLLQRGPEGTPTRLTINGSLPAFSQVPVRVCYYSPTEDDVHLSFDIGAAPTILVRLASARIFFPRHAVSQEEKKCGGGRGKSCSQNLLRPRCPVSIRHSRRNQPNANHISQS